MLRLVIILLYSFCKIGLLAQADPVAEAIKPNVAAISSRFASNTNEQGFGFVVGERNAKATRQAYQDYLSKYPKGQFVTEAREAIQLIDDQEAEKRRRAAEEKQDQEAWNLASEKNKLENYQTYLSQYPQGKYASEARKRRDALLPSPDIAVNNLVEIDGGSFTMGCVENRDGTCKSDETPSHTVTLTGFYLSKYEVTYGQFKAFIEVSQYQTDAEKKGYSYVWIESKLLQKKGVSWKCDVAGNLRNSGESQHPVIHVSLNDAVAYCQWLSKQTGKTYRLPTEAEWEYAARGGKQSKGFKYAGSNQIGDVAWYYDNANKTTHEVGKLQANELGLYDFSSNVWEWCADWYDAAYYKNSPATNPQGPDSGTYSVLRGGSWFYYDLSSRVAIRNGFNPDVTVSVIGFRVARNL